MTFFPTGAPAPRAAGSWHPDVLGEGWEQRTLHLGTDNEGPVDVTLVRLTRGPRRDRAVLYVHGFVDYFFQTHVGEALDAAGWDFYAVDLRRYGRSLRPGQTANLVDDLAVHAEDLDAALAVVRDDEHHDRIAVLGHSTGGLVASLWANARPGRIDALVLNSPWLELNDTALMRTVGTQALRVLGRVAPRTVVGHLAPHYGRALHTSTGGEWDYDLAWKPIDGFPVRARWIASVRRAHARVARGLDVTCPVLVLTSDATGDHENDHPEVLTTDSVLSVEQTAALAPGLGADVTYEQIPGGAHDLALSPEPARSQYLARVVGWLDEVVPPGTQAL
ncbi:alpha/beta hydrolase [Flavimobilis sp. GY10621]|uniref:Alpha/beta hydrolase n=1 Tax=Flavimobilis rhizosphaerae TaxID=2775421 RepID=A0ABR9DLE2_9MICO|nr:alpha/beta hydrolase [Flavimobilis rhizosphaerae]MBD9697913.1 alpha/beta hydrolase [Flavimobilis rhizosphaerae]